MPEVTVIGIDLAKRFSSCMGRATTDLLWLARSFLGAKCWFS